MKHTKLITPFLLAFLSTVSHAGELTPWSKRLDEAGFKKIDQDIGVQVYKDPHSKIIRIAAEGRFAHAPADVLEAVLDYKAQVGVVKRVTEIRIISYRPGSLMVYQHLNLPVISDRDYTLKVTWGGTKTHLWVNFRSSSKGPGKREGIVRVDTHQGSWQLRSIENGRSTLARFQVKIDLGGSLPKWMARLGAGNELRDLYQDIRRVIAAQNKRGSSCRLITC